MAEPRDYVRVGLCAVVLTVAGWMAVGGPSVGRTVRIELDHDAGLEELAAAVRAELVSAGFALSSDGSTQAGPAAAVARLRPFGAGGALVEVKAAGFARLFSAEVAVNGRGTGRSVDEAALLVTEWLTAIALPAPAPARAAAGASAVEPPPRPVTEDAETPVSAHVRSPRRAGPRGEPDASIDWAVGMWRPRTLPTRTGPQLGLTLLHRASSSGGTTLFLRTLVGLYWMGPRMGEWALGPMDVIYGSAGVSLGAHHRISRSWSLELQGSLGLALVWLQVGVAGPFSRYTFDDDRRWLGAAGGGIQVAYRLSWHWALALDAGGFWMFPGVVRDSSTIVRETTSAPAFSSAFALRMAL